MPELRSDANGGAVIRTAVVGLGAISLEHLKRLSALGGVKQLHADARRARARRGARARAAAGASRPDPGGTRGRRPCVRREADCADARGLRAHAGRRPRERPPPLRELSLPLRTRVQQAFEAVHSGALGDVVNVDVWYDGVMTGP